MDLAVLCGSGKRERFSSLPPICCEGECYVKGLPSSQWTEINKDKMMSFINATRPVLNKYHLGKSSNFALLSKVQEAIPSSDIMPL